MYKATSKDGTPIAFERTGHGPPLILVVGAFNDRATGSSLAEFLGPHFTVFSYDRRGRGDSSDAQQYAIEREVEDLDALVREAGGSAAVFGYSSGAWLALHAAARGVAATRLVLFEAPPRQPVEHVAALTALVAAGRRGDAVEYFQHRMVGIPLEVVAQLRGAPFRPALEAMAHTLVYDATILSSAPNLSAVRQPTLLIAGGATAPVMRETAKALSASLPHARAVTISRATHDLDASLIGPVVEGFLREAQAPQVAVEAGRRAQS